MNGEGQVLGEKSMKMESKERLVHMWGYLPGARHQRSPLLSPTVVRSQDAAGADCSGWKDVCRGGCGFAMAISESGKLITWGLTDDIDQSYVTSGEQWETRELFPPEIDASIMNAAAGWAHCVAVTDNGVVHTWGWKECVTSAKDLGDSSASEHVSFQFQGSRSSSDFATLSGFDSKGSVEEVTKRRRIFTVEQAAEVTSSSEETPSNLPCVITMKPGVRIATVAAGVRHTLALSDVGQVWAWGYGGEGQLGMGSRMCTVSSPQPVACLETSLYADGRSMALPQGSTGSEMHSLGALGSYVKQIACGGQHSAVITDAGALLTFGWGLYGQCGQGSTDDELSPICVTSLLGIRVEVVAAGLWHTVCISADGDAYSFGWNQFGQLGTGADQTETLPRLLDALSLENVHIEGVSCGARHTAVITDDGKVFCWGWNKYGQLGLGDMVDRNIPSRVAVEGCIPKKVACGWWHTLLLSDSLI
ncbi:hypothetical protein SAY86_030331 [Trapa natans]|uniref:RCC1-like domain-containing protein n=1 Tax=Trapa natans TaxID=22666 RepID=A0AAN7RDM5_TRANT|nr:hypothetical protein SAY86_030331 [Trapa natans]